MNDPIIPPLAPVALHHALITWQQQNGRHDLPWQQQPTPYSVLVSEIMLQQTQVATVIPYYQRWLEKFPNFESLAAASEDDVLTLWQGLGYYSRARNLHRAAQFVVAERGGILPPCSEQLREVPGVGPYTAGAICAFAFDHPAPLVDGNVTRFFSRYFGITGDVTSSRVSKHIWQLADDYTPPQNNRVYAQALLDMGATVCTPSQPQCHGCPVQSSCNAWQTDRVLQLPEKKKKAPIPTRAGWFGLDVDPTGVVLVQRDTAAVWPRLWCLPEFTEQPTKLELHGEFRHTFSHYKLNVQVFTYQAAADNRRVPWQELTDYALPTPIRRYLMALKKKL